MIRVGAVEVLLCHTISGNGDPQLYRAFGIDQKMYDWVVKADTPGAAASDIQTLPFTKSHLHAFPWVDRADFDLEVVLRKLGG